MSLLKYQLYLNMDYQDEVLNDDREGEMIELYNESIYAGLILKKDYILLQRIGYGRNATVWLSYKISKKEFVAVKVQDHDVFQGGQKEIFILEKVRAYINKHQYTNTHCLKMLDNFTYQETVYTCEEAINAKYACSVFNLYAGNIYSILNRGKYKYGLPIPIVKRITKQLLTALIILHNELKIIHTDVKPDNILFVGLPEYQSKIIHSFINGDFQEKYDNLCKVFIGKKFDEELKVLALDAITSLDEDIKGLEDFMPEEDSDREDEYDVCENPDDDQEQLNEELIDTEVEKFNERDQSVDDIVEHLYRTEMHNLDEECKYCFNEVLNNRENSTDKRDIINDNYILNCEIVLGDYGNSYLFNRRTINEIQDRRYRAPEIVLDLDYGYSCDIWSVSCVVFELLTGFSLFEPDDHPLDRDIHHLYLMEKMLGPMPKAMKKKSKRSRFLFDPKRAYHIKNIETFSRVSIKERLIKQFLFSEQEASEISAFLLCGLVYNPKERITAKEMLNHSWLYN